MDRAISPTGTVIVLVLALVIDFMSVGPDSIRDRLAFLLAVAGFRDGFNDSPLDRWTVTKLSEMIGWALDQTGTAYIAGASANAVVGALVGCLALYTVGCLLPVRTAARLGRFAAISFPSSNIHRLNYRLWACAFLIGIMAELPRGLIGGWTEGAVIFLTTFISPLVILLFGAA